MKRFLVSKIVNLVNWFLSDFWESNLKEVFMDPTPKVKWIEELYNIITISSSLNLSKNSINVYKNKLSTIVLSYCVFNNYQYNNKNLNDIDNLLSISNISRSELDLKLKEQEDNFRDIDEELKEYIALVAVICEK